MKNAVETVKKEINKIKEIPKDFFDDFFHHGEKELVYHLPPIKKGGVFQVEISYRMNLKDKEELESGKPNIKNLVVYSMTFQDHVTLVIDCLEHGDHKYKVRFQSKKKKGVVHNDAKVIKIPKEWGFFVTLYRNEEKFKVFRCKELIDKKEVFDALFGKSENGTHGGFVGRPTPECEEGRNSKGHKELFNVVEKENPRHKVLSKNEMKELKLLCQKKNITYELKEHEKKVANMKKREFGKNSLIVLIDGTGQSETSKNKTNIYYLWKLFEKKHGMSNVKYFSGVGTHDESLYEDINGEETDDIIFNVYEEICKFKENLADEKPEIYIFGFSRGSFCVLSLVNVLRIYGVAKSADAIHVKKHYSGDKSAYDLDPSQEPQLVNVLGMYDCVSTIFYGNLFHQVDVSNCTKAVHICSLLEKRTLFFNTFPNNDTSSNSQLKTIWCLGDHSDIGGGHNTRDLSNITLLQMLEECELDFDSNELSTNKVIKMNEIKNKKGLIFKRKVKISDLSTKLIYRNRKNIIRTIYMKPHHEIHPSVFSLIGRGLVGNKDLKCCTMVHKRLNEEKNDS